MEEVKFSIGSKLRYLREMKGISQENMALDLGISQQSVQKIETGKTKINIDRANKIAKSLDLDLQSLLDFQPANYVSNCHQGGVMNTYNFLNEKLLAQLESQNAALTKELAFSQKQNMILLKIIEEKF
ncbi:MAG: helix-turn-helix domain-containing protein [Bacteroidetes bacterium]|jgi:transcriptional regulator with XRE-family HTH domain|nr:helix-turn-helix domain-containing protein [Bacteroidota bacterium]